MLRVLRLPLDLQSSTYDEVQNAETDRLPLEKAPSEYQILQLLESEEPLRIVSALPPSMQTKRRSYIFLATVLVHKTTKPK